MSKPTTKPPPGPKGKSDMKNADNVKCPVCGSNRYTAIAPEIEFFYIHGCNHACTLNGCLDCGVVYIPRGCLVEARNYHDQT